MEVCPAPIIIQPAPPIKGKVARMPTPISFGALLLLFLSCPHSGEVPLSLPGWLLGGVCVSATPLHPRPQKEQGSGALIKFLPRALNSLICLQKKLTDASRPENLLSAIPTALKAEGWCCSMMPYPFPQSHTSREQQLLQTAGIRDPHQLHFHENTSSRATETQLVQR